MAITVITDVNKINSYGWDYPVEELEYLAKEYDGSVFVVCGNRLFETEESILLEP